MTENNNNEWFEDIEDTDTEEGDSSRFEIMNYPADTTLSGYFDQWKNKQLIIPEFQRNYVWDQVRASKLIESFLLGLPVPGVFLYKERDSAQYLVIDGNQRINTIVSFIKGIFKEKKFKLKGVSTEWEGKTFDDLNDKDTFKLSTSVMRATIIQQINPEDKSSIYHIFERLNTGGMNLNAMEVRMCIAEGTFTTFLRELNKDEDWRILITKPNEDSRIRDIEWILRILALHDKGDFYEKPMKGFINDYIEANRDQDAEWIEKKRRLFITAVQKARKLSDKPFHLKGKLNYAVMDSILVGLMDSSIDDPGKLVAAYKELVADEEFLDAVAISTSDKHNVLKRIERTKHYFAE